MIISVVVGVASENGCGYDEGRPGKIHLGVGQVRVIIIHINIHSNRRQRRGVEG